MVPSVVLVALLTTQLAGKTLALDAAHSKVEFQVDHPLHKVHGRANTVEAKAAVGQDGKVLAMVRIPAASLDSGDANRDANMRDVLEVSKYPFIVFKAIGNVPPALQPGKAVEVPLRGELDLHGVKKPIELLARVELADGGAVHLQAVTHFSLEAFNIARPSLLLVKLEDDCRISVDVLLRDATP